MVSEKASQFFTFCAFGKLTDCFPRCKNPRQEARESIQCHCFALLRWRRKITLQRYPKHSEMKELDG